MERLFILCQQVFAKVRWLLTSGPARLQPWIRASFATVRALAIGRERPVRIVVVITLHLIAIWCLAGSIVHTAPAPHDREISVAFVTVAAMPAPFPDPKPVMVDPTAEIVPPPDVLIAGEGPTAITGADSTMLLAPRPDPAHFNVPPQVPAGHTNATGALAVILKILVRPDGSIGDAAVTRSSGMSDLDLAAIRYVKDNWRFIPAMLGAQAVQDWTTELVPFRSST